MKKTGVFFVASLFSYSIGTYWNKLHIFVSPFHHLNISCGITSPFHCNTASLFHHYTITQFQREIISLFHQFNIHHFIIKYLHYGTIKILKHFMIDFRLGLSSQKINISRNIYVTFLQVNWIFLDNGTEILHISMSLDANTRDAALRFSNQESSTLTESCARRTNF